MAEPLMSSCEMEYPMRVKGSRTAVVSAVAAVIIMGIGVSAAIGHRTMRPGPFFGVSARHVADVLRCADHVAGRPNTGGADYRDQGTCRLGSYWVKITTFNNAAD
jgi:hypothetical protein